MELGSKLGGASISLQHDIILGSGEALELIAPIEIYAKTVSFESNNLVLRPSSDRTADAEVFVKAESVTSKLENFSGNNVGFSLQLESMDNIHYPLVAHAQKADPLPTDLLLREKYLRLRRILTEFRSHSKGSLARYKEKIESDRVLSGDIGVAVLNRLKSDEIIKARDKHYHLNPDLISRHLGVTWHDLRRGALSQTVVNYLQKI